MNGKDMLTGLSFINRKFIEESETEFIHQEKTETKRILRKPLLIAAIIALMVFFMGCAVILHMWNLKIGERDSTRDIYDEYHRQITGTQPVSQQVLTLSGLKGFPSYLAAKEWFAFLETYDPDGTIRKQAFQSDPEELFPDTYRAYFTYSQEMVDELEYLAEKYGLKLLGAPLQFDSMGAMTRAIGIDHVMLPDSNVSSYLTRGNCYPSGNFDISMKLNMPDGEGMWPYTIHARLVYCRNDCLSTEYAYLDLDKEWEEWNYATRSGETILIIRAPEGEAYLICDCGDSTMTVHFEAGYNPLTDDPDFVPEWMTNRQVEQIADAVDFTIRPQLPDTSAAAISSHASGWEIETKEVFYDGSFGRVVFRLTAPEGTVLPCADGEYVYPDNRNGNMLVPETGAFHRNFWVIASEEDGDGLTNTTDLVYLFGMETIDDPAFPLNAKWTAHFEDFTAQYLDGEKTQNEIIAEGVWETEVSFADCELRTIELLTKPITVSCQGRQMTIESIQLRSLGTIFTLTENIQDGDYLNAVAIMEDGSEIPMVIGDGSNCTIRRAADVPIDLDQVICVRLSDGTELPVPKA